VFLIRRNISWKAFNAPPFLDRFYINHLETIKKIKININRLKISQKEF